MLNHHNEWVRSSAPAGRVSGFVGDSVFRDGRWGVGYFDGLRLDGALQPIYCLSHKRPIGFEGLIRPKDTLGQPISPGELFGRATNPEQRVHLDRICRAVHIHNFVELGLDEGWLFLNLNPNLFWTYKRDLRAFTMDLLDHFNLDPHRVVLEILEKSIPDEGLMGALVDHYHEKGCLVAIDDFGSGHANFDRIWRFRPDIVKLDQSIITNAMHNPQARRMVPGLVSLIHQAGALVLIEGIETHDQAMIALDAEADFVQGFYFGRPMSDLEDVNELKSDALYELGIRFRHHFHGEAQKQFAKIRFYLDLLQRWIGPIDSLTVLRANALEFAKESGVKRCFILDEFGHQNGPNMAVGHRSHFAHIAGGDGADWSRRTYYRRAIVRHGVPQVIGPYFSQPDASMCITLSMALPLDGVVWVFCADLEWSGSADMVVGENRFT
ncbi:MAG: EAL domain-containing protein [Magnetococcales bacterium]|nr:EAL domain-containing protein [Magnetococcales bacterium]